MTDSLTPFIDMQIEALEKKKEWVSKARDIAEEEGYDLEGFGNESIESVALRAIEKSSDDNARAGGDAWKPYDPDLAFPTDGSFKVFVLELLREEKCPKIVPPIDLTEAFKSIDPNYDGQEPAAFVAHAIIEAKGSRKNSILAAFGQLGSDLSKVTDETQRNLARTIETTLDVQL